MRFGHLDLRELDFSGSPNLEGTTQIQGCRELAKMGWREAGVNTCGDLAVVVPQELGNLIHAVAVLGQPDGSAMPEHVG